MRSRPLLILIAIAGLLAAGYWIQSRVGGDPLRGIVRPTTSRQPSDAPSTADHPASEQQTTSVAREPRELSADQIRQFEVNTLLLTLRNAHSGVPADTNAEKTEVIDQYFRVLSAFALSAKGAGLGRDERIAGMFASKFFGEGGSADGAADGVAMSFLHMLSSVDGAPEISDQDRRVIEELVRTYAAEVHAIRAAVVTDRSTYRALSGLPGDFARDLQQQLSGPLADHVAKIFAKLGVVQ